MGETRSSKAKRGLIGLTGSTSKRRRRGFVFPQDGDDPSVESEGEANAPEYPRGRRRRRRHRRRGMSKTEMFVGFLVSWMIMILAIVLLELVSESDWFFVEYSAAQSIEQGTWIIGDKAYLPDGRVTQLDPKNAEVSGATDITGELGKGPHAPILRWDRLLIALFAVPALVFAMTIAYRRIVKSRVKDR